VPTLIAVHPENNPNGAGFEQASVCSSTGGQSRSIELILVAEVKSDLMGEQTILCGILQTGSILCFDKMVEKELSLLMLQN
jgi:ketol-acid reductoisomerase